DIDDLMLLCKADITSKNERKVKRIKANYERVSELLVEIEEKDRIRNWQPPIDGQHIMESFDIKPSRAVGEIKTAIREAILDGIIANNFEEAEAFMFKIGKEMGLGSGKHKT
ncbi:MAG: tRNA nucleotidyltransferase, partial [Saprospiraceae bacterium]